MAQPIAVTGDPNDDSTGQIGATTPRNVSHMTIEN